MATTTSPTTGNESNRPINLLSLDAGGPQGVSQLLILKNVMERLSKDENGDFQEMVKRPCDIFDMIGGSGTGGLISIFLVVFKMTAKDALIEFTHFVDEVFKDIARDPMVQTEKLTRAINGILKRNGIAQDMKLVLTSELAPKCRLMVPIMYKNHVGTPCILRNYVPTHEPPVGLTIAEAMLATCSSPPIFTPVTIRKDFATFEYVSGDLGLSNPTRETIAEAHRAFGDERAVSCLLSIGCGHPGVNAVPNASSGTPWIEFLDGLARDSEKTAQDIATQMSKITAYHRLSVNPGLEKGQRQERADLDMTIAHTTTYLNDLDIVDVLNRCVDRIKHGGGFTTLERLKYCGGEEVLSPPLPPLAVNYVERTVPMEFLEKTLFEEDRRIRLGSKIIVVTGIGGCGKTQLTRRFIEKYKDIFVSTFFIDGSSPDTIRRDIVRHVRALGGTCSQKPFEECMVFLSQAADGQRLLIIDNVDDPTLDLSPFLPRWQNGVVMVTSRNHSRGQLSAAEHLQLNVMTVEESTELLIRGSGQQWPPLKAERTLAISVAEELGCHPIALVQAISYMYNTGCSPGTYVTLLRSSRDGLLRDHPATSQVDMRYKTAFAAFDASYKILPPKARNLWHLLSFFQSRNFPVELITMAALEEFSIDPCYYLPHGGQFELGKGCLKDIFYTSDRWEPLELQSILASLRSHSLITFISVESTTLLQMHPLVHEWGRLCVAEGSLGRFEAAAVRLLCCGVSEDNYAMMQYLSGHVNNLSFLWNGLHANDATSLAFILKQSGMYEKVAMLGDIAHEMVKRELGFDHPNTISTASNLAGIYQCLGRFAEANGLQTEVLRKRKLLLGVNHPDTIRASAELAAVYYQLGRYAEAEELYTEVLRRRKQMLDLDHPDTIEASANLATVYHALGRYAEAEELHTEVLRRRRQLLGVDHPDTIKASASLASIYHVLGRYAEAEERKTEVLRRRKQLLGSDHPDTIEASANLAATYHELGRYAEVEELETEVLRMRKKLLGVDHPDTIRASSNLAATYHMLGRYAEVEELDTEVLRRRRQLQGVDHPDTVRASAQLAITYGALGRHAEAEKLTAEALQRQRNFLGANHPDTIKSSAELAVIRFGLGRYTEAEELHTEVLKKRTVLLGERHPDTIQSMLYLAQTYGATQRQSEASILTQKALQLALETLGEEHPLSKEISEFLTYLSDEPSLSDEEPTRIRRRDRFVAYMRRTFRL